MINAGKYFKAIEDITDITLIELELSMNSMYSAGMCFFFKHPSLIRLVYSHSGSLKSVWKVLLHTFTKILPLSLPTHEYDLALLTSHLVLPSLIPHTPRSVFCSSCLHTWPWLPPWTPSIPFNPKSMLYSPKTFRFDSFMDITQDVETVPNCQEFEKEKFPHV